MPRLQNILFLGGTVCLKSAVSQLVGKPKGPVGKLLYVGVLQSIGLSPDSSLKLVIGEVVNFLFFCVKRRLV